MKESKRSCPKRAAANRRSRRIRHQPSWIDLAMEEKTAFGIVSCVRREGARKVSLELLFRTRPAE